MHRAKTGSILTGLCLLAAIIVIFSAREFAVYTASRDATEASRSEIMSVARKCITDYYVGSPAPAEHWQNIGDFLNQESQSEDNRLAMLRMVLLTCDTSGGANSLVFASLAFKDRKALSRDLKTQIQLGRISNFEKLKSVRSWIGELDRMEQQP